jgi:ribonuclease HI
LTVRKYCKFYKQPVCKRGSILLGELIAIKIVLEYIDQPEIRRKIELTIFSDSQTAIGILTPHWKIENQRMPKIKKKSPINDFKTKMIS